MIYSVNITCIHHHSVVIREFRNSVSPCDLVPDEILEIVDVICFSIRLILSHTLLKMPRIVSSLPSQKRCGKERQSGHKGARAFKPDNHWYFVITVPVIIRSLLFQGLILQHSQIYS